MREAVRDIAALFLRPEAAINKQRAVENRVRTRMLDAQKKGRLKARIIEGRTGKHFDHSELCAWLDSTWPKEAPRLRGFQYPARIGNSAATLGGVAGESSGITWFADDIEWLRENYQRLSAERAIHIEQIRQLQSDLEKCREVANGLLAEKQRRSDVARASGRKNPGRRNTS